MDHFPGTHWGRPLAAGTSSTSNMFDAHATFPTYSFKDPSPAHSHAGEVQHTQQPIMTGTSVVATKFKGGVVIAADMLGSYGSLARFRDITRLKQVGSHTIIGAGGDLSDWQNIQHTLDKVMLKETVANDGHTLTTSQIYEYLARLMYQRRSKMDPLWNAMLVGGVEKGVPFLGYVDLLGTTYSSPTLATGFGNHIAQPILRRAYELKENAGEEFSEEEARKVIEDCLRVLFYRDARSLNKFLIAVVDQNGVRIEGPKSVSTEWGFAEGLRGYGAQTQ